MMAYGSNLLQSDAANTERKGFTREDGLRLSDRLFREYSSSESFKDRGRLMYEDGNVNSLEWNDGMERWSGLLEWSTGLDHWSVTPTNQLVKDYRYRHYGYMIRYLACT